MRLVKVGERRLRKVRRASCQPEKGQKGTMGSKECEVGQGGRDSAIGTMAIGEG